LKIKIYIETVNLVSVSAKPRFIILIAKTNKKTEKCENKTANGSFESPRILYA